MNFIGVGVTLEVSAPPLQEKVKMDVESREKNLGWVTRGEESESDVCVGVTLEVGLHRLNKKLKWT